MTAALRLLTGAALTVLLTAVFPANAHAQKIALLHADMPTRADAVCAKLNTAGLTDVTVINVGTGGVTPTLEDLQPYNAVLTWSIAGYLNAAELGDTLATYVDDGGGVVQALFSFAPGATLLGGRWESEQYAALTPASLQVGAGLTLVATQPGHAILSGVVFDPGSPIFFGPSDLQGGSEAVAHWSNLFPLVATRPGPVGGKIVGLNLYPFVGEAGQLMANALRFVAGDVPPPVDGPAVALLAAGGASAGAHDVRSKLRALSLFSRVDVIDAAAATAPTLASLLQYDAVMTWSSSNYGNPAGLGGVLADYVDQNRGVVQAVFGFDPDAGLHLEGRWLTEGYRPFAEGAPQLPPPAPLTLMPVLPAHPILSNVLSFNGGTSSHHNATVMDGATTLVATWSNGQPLVAFGTKPSGGRLVGLNMYPPSNDAVADLWDRTTDGAWLMANALLFAANHFPTASAGDDQTGAATSPSGVSFTLNATADDLDGDPLSFEWSGAVTATGESIVVDVPPPPAPSQSHSVTVVLTVADGKGGVATDSVVLTVTDMVAPVLHNVPSDISVEATSASGAEVSYGPVTATDAVDGDVPVGCSHSGTFPVGSTLVTCSASDSRGNTASGSFTVTVTEPASEDPGPSPEPGVPGRAYGHGFIREDHWQYEFGFAARENAAGAERGGLQLEVKAGHAGHRAAHRSERRGGRFVSNGVSSVTFGADATVLLTGTGRWNGTNGYRFELSAADKRFKRRVHDLVRMTITSPTGEVVAHVEGRLAGGNIRIWRSRHSPAVGGRTPDCHSPSQQCRARRRGTAHAVSLNLFSLP